MDTTEPEGTPIAAPPSVARRVGAMIGLVVLIALAVALMWRVYLHHERTDELADEPAFVFNPPSAAWEKFAPAKA